MLEVDDALLCSTDPLTVRLTNDRFEEGKGDRNLQIISADVAGTPLKVGDFVVMRDGTPIGDGRPPGDALRQPRRRGGRGARRWLAARTRGRIFGRGPSSHGDD